MNNFSLSECLKQPIHWEKTDRAEFPYAVEIKGKKWSIRINDFPVEPLYTLFIDDQEIGSFDDWSNVWQK
jgi:hypothetical protein